MDNILLLLTHGRVWEKNEFFNSLKNFKKIQNLHFTLAGIRQYHKIIQKSRPDPQGFAKKCLIQKATHVKNQPDFAKIMMKTEVST